MLSGMRFAEIVHSETESLGRLVSVFAHRYGSACGPVIVPVFKTGGWQAILSPVGSTPTRFRHMFSTTYVANVLKSVLGTQLSVRVRLPEGGTVYEAAQEIQVRVFVRHKTTCDNYREE